VPADDLALVADLLDARLNLHSSNLFNRRLGARTLPIWRWNEWPSNAHANPGVVTTEDRLYTSRRRTANARRREWAPIPRGNGGPVFTSPRPG
jgi:hypothetical protein